MQILKSSLVVVSLITSIGCLASTPPKLKDIVESKIVTLTWTHSPSPDVSHYEVCYGLANDLSECVPIDIGYKDSHLIEISISGDYDFYLQAVKAGGEQSEWLKGLAKDGADFLTIVTQIRPVVTGLEVN